MGTTVKSQIGALSILGERRACPPPLALSPQLPVPGPGGFGQLTRPPGEIHTDRYTQPQRITNGDRHKQVGTERPTETRHRKIDKKETGEGEG